MMSERRRRNPRLEHCDIAKYCSQRAFLECCRRGVQCPHAVGKLFYGLSIYGTYEMSIGGCIIPTSCQMTRGVSVDQLCGLEVHAKAEICKIVDLTSTASYD
jgi:hypothetical protein